MAKYFFISSNIHGVIPYCLQSKQESREQLRYCVPHIQLGTAIGTFLYLCVLGYQWPFN